MMQIWRHEKVRNLLAQVFVLLAVVLLFYYLWENLQSNLIARGITSGFDFLDNKAGFNIIMHLIDYNEQASYLRAFFVGLLNTVLVAGVGIVIATLLGVLLGIARVSQNWLWSKIALVYVEFLRNIPLLLQIFFGYFVVLRAAPHPRQAFDLGGIVFVTSRGIYLPKPALWYWVLAIVLAILLVRWLFAKKQTQLEGLGTDSLSSILILTRLRKVMYLAGGLAILFLVGYMPYDIPHLQGFNFRGGIVLIPEFLALLLALSLYTAAFIAEIVRSGILAIPKGQWEAAKALGLNNRQMMKQVILPQATKMILPPLTNQYLNLTKNSSLAAAVAYPDLVSVFAGTVLNQTGQAVEIIAMTMAVYLLISISISLGMQYYEKKTRWGAV